MYKVGVTGDFVAVHALVGDVPPEEKTPHPHTYHLEWTLDVSALDERGFSLDISELERIRDEFFSETAGTVLNDIDWFKGKPTSLENLCEYAFDSLENAIMNSINSKETARISRMEVDIWEHDQAWAGIERALKPDRSK